LSALFCVVRFQLKLFFSFTIHVPFSGNQMKTKEDNSKFVNI
jgi:hypothetical protein